MVSVPAISFPVCILFERGRFSCEQRKRAHGALAVLLLAVISGAFPGGSAEAGTGRGAAPGRITVTRAAPEQAGRTYRVALLCDTTAKRAQGLQGFRTLRRDEAALFVFRKPEPATFWMGSVAYPIDIAFVDARGTVVRVYRHCPPGSRDLFPSGIPVKWVIETAGGSGIAEGDKVAIEGAGGGSGVE